MPTAFDQMQALTPKKPPQNGGINPGGGPIGPKPQEAPQQKAPFGYSPQAPQKGPFQGGPGGTPASSPAGSSMPSAQGAGSMAPAVTAAPGMGTLRMGNLPPGGVRKPTVGYEEATGATKPMFGGGGGYGASSTPQMFDPFAGEQSGEVTTLPGYDQMEPGKKYTDSSGRWERRIS
jgi:hypothetical protein